MKSTGMVRRLDELGRIVLPMEIRTSLGINPKDPLEIFVNGDSIVLKKCAPACTFCGSAHDNIDYAGKKICKSCLEKINKQNQ